MSATVPGDPQAATPTPVPVPRPRLESVDLLRGLVMGLMALDHTRHYFSNNAIDPIDLTQASASLFLTRWITHICAPVFVLLAGTGAFLSTTRGRTTCELSRFLWTRGLWLVLLELTCLNWFGWRFEITLRAYGVQVIWAIGCSMIVLAGLVWLPRWAIAAFGLVMIVAHNALDRIRPEGFGFWPDLWRVLHTGGGFEIVPGVHFFAGYPLIPWVGVMAVGYAFGPVLLRDPGARRQWLLRVGIALTLLFIVVRATNLYGDPVPWAAQKNAWFTLFSFVNCTKYPVSLCFLLMTLGPSLLLLARFDRGTPGPLKPLLVFGRVPLFFYLLHLPFIHGLALLANFVRHGGSPPPDAGFGLMGVYLLSILIVALLYPVCRWFAEFKRTHHGVWLSYF